MTMRLVQRSSPNWNARPAGSGIDCVLLHATADHDTDASVEWCLTPSPQNPAPVSYHAIIDRDGTLISLVDVAKRAWHAGVSSFQGRGNVNDYSIGLSFANDNSGEALTDVQLAVGAALVAQYMRRFPAITLDRITTHAIVALPLGRKTDPAAPFDLDAFKLRVVRELATRPGAVA